MDDPIAFAVALRRMGGEDFFNDATLGPRFRGMPHYFLYGLETRTLDQPWNAHGWSGRDRATNIYSWLALAGALKDPVAQWIATRDNGLAKLDPLLGYLFYDPDVPATPPTDPAGSVYFPYSGLVKLCSDWSAEGILIPFRCGPRMAVDQGDQNGFRLRAGGDWLVPRLNQVDRLPEQTDLFNYDLMGWFWGSAAQNVVVADPDHIADYQTYRKTGGIPVGGGVQWSTYTEFKYNMAPTNERRPQPSYDKHQEWLLEPSTPKTGDLRVVSFDPALDYVCGENHRSYFFSQPTLALRHVLFVKAGAGSPSAPYVLICDEIDFADQPHTLAWQLHAGASLMTKGNRMEIDGPHASLAVHWLLPADGRLVTKQTPAPLEKERTEFVQYQTAAPVRQGVYVTVLLPRKNGTAEAEPEMKIIPAEGGWAVEVHGAEGTDVALFRAGAADAVSAAGVTTQGTAALLRRPDRGQAVLYTLGK
jgi:hypothetical protein